MKQLTSDIHDAGALQQLGRASTQIVHDLKNQINGLKLYATFLRKRMEKDERPLDEQEAINKLIAGLERAATDMTALVRFGRPVELRRQTHVDLAKVLRTALDSEDTNASIEFGAGADMLTGEFDAAVLTEALKAITIGAQKMCCSAGNGKTTPLIHLCKHERVGDEKAMAVIEWRGVEIAGDADPFRSFAGSDALRMSVAARTIEAHGGTVTHESNLLRARLPLTPN